MGKAARCLLLSSGVPAPVTPHHPLGARRKHTGRDVLSKFSQLLVVTSFRLKREKPPTHIVRSVPLSALYTSSLLKYNFSSTYFLHPHFTAHICLLLVFHPRIKHEFITTKRTHFSALFDVLQETCPK